MYPAGHTTGESRSFSSLISRTPGHGQAVVHLILTATLVVGIAAVGTLVSIGFARAQSMTGVREPDTSLVLGMLAGAVAVMSILSALAVRFIGRPRQR
jgi:hypothetical protein